MAESDLSVAPADGWCLTLPVAIHRPPVMPSGWAGARDDGALSRVAPGVSTALGVPGPS